MEVKVKVKRISTQTRIEALVALLEVGGYIWVGLAPSIKVKRVSGPMNLNLDKDSRLFGVKEESWDKGLSN